MDVGACGCEVQDSQGYTENPVSKKKKKKEIIGPVWPVLEKSPLWETRGGTQNEAGT